MQSIFISFFSPNHHIIRLFGWRCFKKIACSRLLFHIKFFAVLMYSPDQKHELSNSFISLSFYRNLSYHQMMPIHIFLWVLRYLDHPRYFYHRCCDMLIHCFHAHLRVFRLQSFQNFAVLIYGFLQHALLRKKLQKQVPAHS